MPTRTPRILLALLAAFSVSMAGCGKVQNAAKRSQASNDLKELGLAYINFQDMENRPPKSYEELNKKIPMTPRCAQATVVWGAGMVGLCKDGATTEIVIAHVPNPGAKGVLALYCDGSVQLLTDQEFSAAKKAKPLPPK